MVVGELAEPVDLLVVGGGVGGYVAALRAAQLGRKVTLVERHGPEGLGGCCVHVGCIPSKALIELASAASLWGAMAPAGLFAREVGVDLARFQSFKRGITSRLGEGVRDLLAGRDVRVLHGELTFNRRDRAAVRTPDGNVRFLEFRHAIVATGSRPVAPRGLEPDGDRILDSTDMLALEAVPEELAVVGAGYIGLELGTAMAKLGARVTLVETLDRVLPTLDPLLGRPVARRLRELGPELLVRSCARALEDGELVVETPDGDRRLSGARVLVAVGRRPNTDQLGLERAGVAVGADGLVAVGRDRRATDRIAAVGDIVAGPPLAHKALKEGMVAAEALCDLPAEFAPWTIPQVVFGDPEVATAGLTEAEARAAGMDVSVGRFPLSASGRAATLGVREGFTTMVVDREADRIVGVHIVGPHASELIAEGVLAIEMMASPEDVGATVHPHPTLTESLAEAAEVLNGRSLYGSSRPQPRTPAAPAAPIAGGP